MEQIELIQSKIYEIRGQKVMIEIGNNHKY